MYLNDLEAIMKSFDEFLKETIDMGDNNLLISSSASNSELTPELSQFIERTELDLEDIIESANSYAEMEQLIYHYVDLNREGLNSEELSVLVLTTHLELIYTRFIIQNMDLLEFSNQQGSSHSGIYNQKSEIEEWGWAKIKKWAKCAVGVVSGTVTGTVSGCVGVGGLAFQISGGVATLPVSGEAALIGCAVGGVLGGLAGAGIGAVNGGCFD